MSQNPPPCDEHVFVANNADGISTAAKALKSGTIVAFPTETVYGLGADAGNDEAVVRVFAAKDRPSFNPLIVHVPDTEAARPLVRFTIAAEELARQFWPGALTIVLTRRANAALSLSVSAGLDTVALRVPAHETAHALLTAADCPVAAPSANRSGAVSPTTAKHVAASLPGPEAGGPACIVDGGACPVGLESTVVDVTGANPILLRPGGVTAEEIETVIGPLAAPGEGALRSPGMLARHYAPATPLRLDAREAQPGEALLGFGPNARSAERNLSPLGNLAEAAANLFAMLRELDAENHAGIAVSSVPDYGLGRAINDRLRRAASSAAAF